PVAGERNARVAAAAPVGTPVEVVGPGKPLPNQPRSSDVPQTAKYGPSAAVEDLRPASNASSAPVAVADTTEIPAVAHEAPVRPHVQDLPQTAETAPVAEPNDPRVAPAVPQAVPAIESSE